MSHVRPSRMVTGPLTGVGVGESSTNGCFVPGGRRHCALVHVGQLPLKQEVAPPVGPVLYSKCKHRVPLNSQSTAGSDLDTGEKKQKKTTRCVHRRGDISPVRTEHRGSRGVTLQTENLESEGGKNVGCNL